MSELKNCPFCGATATRIGESVSCDNCGVTTDDALCDWNRRADGWVKTSEGLPANKKQCAVYWKDGCYDIYTYYDKDKDMWLNNIVIWHPLPATPVEG